MTPPLALTTLPRTSLRLLVASCAHDLCPDLEASRTQEPYATVWTRLGDHAWVPSAADCPLPLATVETWLVESQGKLRQWLETHLSEETTVE